MTLESAAAFYALNPVFSDFVFVTGNGTLSMVASALIELQATGFGREQVEPFCARQLAVVEEGGATRVYVDSELDAAVTCGLEVPSCESVDLIAPPAELELEAATFVQCRSNGVFAALTLDYCCLEQLTGDAGTGSSQSTDTGVELNASAELDAAAAR